jgi:hypothetical protein
LFGATFSARLGYQFKGLALPARSPLVGLGPEVPGTTTVPASTDVIDHDAARYRQPALRFGHRNAASPPPARRAVPASCGTGHPWVRNSNTNKK